ncbi:MAG: hypothetical protein KF708_13455 [Pirellulales bacterium]|nr:hypothetical protein [Pirellulales bacterium]
MDAGAIYHRNELPLASRAARCAKPAWLSHLLTIVSLSLLAVLVQGTVIYRSVVPALDAVRYVAEAKQLAISGSMRALLHSADDAPLFPAAVAGTYGLLEPWLGLRRDGWAFAAQLASATALVLAVPFVYLLALPQVGRRAACLAGGFFCVLPEFARLGGDAIGDSLGLLLFAITCSLFLYGGSSVGGTAGLSGSDVVTNQLSSRSRHNGTRRFFQHLFPALGGIAAAAALLVGLETLVLLVAIAAMTIRPAWRTTALFTIAGCALALGAWYAVGLVVPEFPTPESPTVETPAAAHVYTPLPVKESTTSIRFHGYSAALFAAGRALPRTLHYVLLPLAVWGLLAAWRERLASRAAIAFVLLFVAMYLSAAVYYAARAGYLEPRHLLPVALVLLPWSAAGTVACAEAVASVFAPPRLRNMLCRGMAALILVACLLQTAKPLHGRRTPHRDAAYWLVAHAQADECVLDSRGWTGLLSGLTSYSFRDSGAALTEPRLRYLVVERHELCYASERSRLLAQWVATSDSPPVEFTSPSGDPGQDVLIVRRKSEERAERVAWNESFERDERRRLDP